MAPSDPRKEIRRKVAEGDMTWLLGKAGELHGHFCPFVALGVKAAVLAHERLGSSTEGIDEDLLAIVEVNNCFSDGVQLVTGCTFGNNALIYRDLGKNALTLARRDGRGVRVSIRPDYPRSMSASIPGSESLFERFIVRREKGTPQEMEHFKEVWEELSFLQIEAPAEKQFHIEDVQVSLPERSPILPSVICSRCGESVMESHARLQEGKPVCLDCLGESYFLLQGRGIAVAGMTASPH
ncbi:MAG: formylmethanofuran dehydrogenase [Deltaproteobacteria bacterium]|nr:MAG: formylmethanofuran dehydrogenase [Deltaproteobacteria bacterium]